VAAAYNGEKACSAQKGYDVLRPMMGNCKSRSSRSVEGAARCHTHLHYDVVTVETVPATSEVESAPGVWRVCGVAPVWAIYIK
jgi:hypothetical protein